MTLKTYITAFLTTVALICHAGPARHGDVTFIQPDGSRFSGRVRGDEFMKIVTTASGNAIIRDADGWWCYAIYGTDGSRSSSGYRVGGDTPSHVLGESAMIPYDLLAQRAHNKRYGTRTRPEKTVLSRVRSLHSSATEEKPEVVSKHGIVILAQYSDVKFKHTKEDFVNLLTQEGYSVGGATGCAKEYFDKQFNGMFNFEFHVSEIVTLDGVRSYYGSNNSYGDDKHPAEMVAEACELADDGTDFSIYDDDNDGYVDNVFVFFAGADEADDPDNNADCIWSHAWYITSGAGLSELKLDGKIIDQYACTAELMPGNEIAGIGSFCHEFSHTLDLPDFYDTDYAYSEGWAPGLWGSTSLMDGGNSNNDFNTPPYYNAMEREIMGLSEPELIESNGTYRLEPIHKEGRYYRLDTDKPEEYYLFECRSKEGWDRYIGGSGMLVYHIDRSSPRLWEENKVNVRPSHQNADLIEADGRSNSLNNSNYQSLMDNISSIFFPYNKADKLTSDSTPGLRFWSGNKCKISITNITRDGDDIVFSVSGFEGENPPLPANLSATAFMDAAIIRFESDRAYQGEATVTWGMTGKEETTVKVSPYEAGKYSLTLEGLEPGNKTYSVSVCFELDGIVGEKHSISFMTSRPAPVEWPYIYVGKVEADENGELAPETEIALRVYNGKDSEDINWSYNGKFIRPEGDGFFTVTESGVLKAYVYWADGSVDILEKKINVSSKE